MHPKGLLTIVSTLVICVLLLPFSGCGSETTAATGGAVAGGALARTFAGMQADLETARQTKLAEMQTAVEELENATTEVQKAAAQAKIKAYEKTIEDLQDGQTGVALAKQGTELDWTDPKAVGGYGGTVVASLLAWYLRKKGKQETADAWREQFKTHKKYQAHKQGVERFMLSRENSKEATDLYDLIGAARTKNGI
jgi:hypothetical protein